MEALRNKGNFHHMGSPEEVSNAACAWVLAMLGTQYYLLLF